jgi:ABC-type polysaccharide/polyol phosphate export permease
MTHVITAVRDVLFTGTMFNITTMLVILAVTLFFMQIGMLYFRASSRFVPKEL